MTWELSGQLYCRAEVFNYQSIVQSIVQSTVQSPGFVEAPVMPTKIINTPSYAWDVVFCTMFCVNK